MPYGGKRGVYGFNNLVDGPTSAQPATAQGQGGDARDAARLSLQSLTLGSRLALRSPRPELLHGNDLAQ